jgi:hypothetical protein
MSAASSARTMLRTEPERIMNNLVRNWLIVALLMLAIVGALVCAAAIVNRQTASGPCYQRS